TADHQRGRKRPGLRSEIGDPAAAYADLLARLPANRLLDRLARLHESGKTRPHALGKPVRAAKHAALARNGEHDHDRISARKMLRCALRTVAPPAALDQRAGRSAIRAETMPPVPAKERLALGERRQMLLRHKAIHRHGPQIGD